MKKSGWATSWKITVCLSALCCCIGIMHASAKSEGTTKVTVHYKQKADDPTDWSLWVWGDNGNGKRFSFTGTDEFGKLAVIELPGAYRKVGVIVSTEDWKKDGGDRFVDIVDGAGEFRITGNGYIDDPSGRDVPYLWAIVGVAAIPALLHAFEHARLKRRGTANQVRLPGGHP